MLPKIPLQTRNEYILGKPRWKWVVHATKALIGATDQHLRWLVIRAGEAEFIRVARPTFKNHEPAIDFTPDELRWMFGILPYSITPRFREAMQAAEIQHLQRPIITDEMLKGTGGEGPTGHDGPTERYDDSDITVETLPDHQKRLVH